MLLFWKRVSGKWFALGNFFLLLFLLLVLLLFLANTEMHQHVKFTEQVPSCWFPVQFLTSFLEILLPKGREEGESSRAEVVIRHPKTQVKQKDNSEPQMGSIFQHFPSNSRMQRNLWIKNACGSLALERTRWNKTYVESHWTHEYEQGAGRKWSPGIHGSRQGLEMLSAHV